MEDQPVGERMIPLSEVWPLLRVIWWSLRERAHTDPLVVSAFDQAAKAAGHPTVVGALGETLS